MVHDSVESPADLPICKQPSLSPHKPAAAKQQQRDATHNLATYHTESHTHTATHSERPHQRNPLRQSSPSAAAHVAPLPPRVCNNANLIILNCATQLLATNHTTKPRSCVKYNWTSLAQNLPVLPPMRLSPSLSHTPFRNPARPHPH